MIRFFVSILLGLAVAFGLLFLMQALIASGKDAASENEKVRIVDFVRVQREETIEHKRSKPDRPSNPDEPPPEAPRPSMDNTADLGGTGGQVVEAVHDAPVAVSNIDMNISSGFGISAGSADGDYLPIVKVAPVYPQRALERGTEGYVIVKFTVTRTGAVRDPVVVEYHPSTVFNRAALAAALKFKYKPRVVDGVPIEVHGVHNKITFMLED